MFFFAITILSPPFLPAQEGSRYALVIGNADYRYINKLNNTIKDARDIAAALVQLGFQVDLWLDVTKEQFADAVKAHTARLAADPQSEGFFWFTGHGAQVQGENYLLSTDIRAGSPQELRKNSVSLNQLLRECEAARNRVNILVVDACRTDPFPASARSFRTNGLAAVRDVPGDIVIMFSTAPDDVASDGPAGKNSPFAQAFLKHIGSSEPVNMMAPDVVRETMIITEGEQRPFMNGSIITNKYYSLNPARTGASSPVASTPALGNAPQTAASAPASTDARADAAPEVTAEMMNKTGIALFAGGEFDQAITAFTLAVTMKPEYAEAYYNRGLVYYAIKAADRALDNFNEAIRLDKKYAAAYFNRGLAYADKGDYARALADYSETIRLNPAHAKARNNRGNVFVALKEYEKAIADYTEAIRLNPMSIAAYRNRGSVYRIQGKRNNADADFAEARKLGWRE
ncbi:MAG: tetratricopeptide repeat protein [Treponema sp.]|nr:tetratricopeptide repeat protein [Treponema sp.]